MYKILNYNYEGPIKLEIENNIGIYTQYLSVTVGTIDDRLKESFSCVIQFPVEDTKESSIKDIIEEEVYIWFKNRFN